MYEMGLSPAFKGKLFAVVDVWQREVVIRDAALGLFLLSFLLLF
jgi:hypothetical protein